jgi:hypothetical protein
VCYLVAFGRSRFPPLQSHTIQGDNDNSLSQLKASIEGDGVLEELSLYCNREFAPLEAILDEMRNIVVILQTAGQRILELASCDRIVPLYTNTFYNGTCEYSLRAIYWIFSCALIIGISGMLMITFRAAYKLDLLEDPNALLESSTDFDLNAAQADQVAEVRVADIDDEEHFGNEYENEPGEQHIQEVTAPIDSYGDGDDDGDEKREAAQIY